jgi:hypothetical protein
LAAQPAARGDGRGEPTFSNDYKSAAVHCSRSSHCNKSMRWIKAVTVQLNTRAQYLQVGDGEAEGGAAPGAWRPQPAPSRCAGACAPYAEISSNLALICIIILISGGQTICKIMLDI